MCSCPMLYGFNVVDVWYGFMSAAHRVVVWVTGRSAVVLCCVVELYS